jgi:hypothetical protein
LYYDNGTSKVSGSLARRIWRFQRRLFTDQERDQFTSTARKNITGKRLSKKSSSIFSTSTVWNTTGAMFFDDSAVRFTDSGTILRRLPSDKSLGYSALCEGTSPMLSSPSLKTFQFLSVKASH